MSTGTEDQHSYCKEFYCGATSDQIPKDIFMKVIAKTVGLWDFIDTKFLAAPLYSEELLTHSQCVMLMNDRVPLDERRNDLLYKILPSKGDQRNVLAKFHLSLLRSQIPQEIPKKIRIYALQECKVDRPIIFPGISTGTAIGGMVLELVGKRVSEESAKDLAKSLELTGDELGDPPETDLGTIFQKWVSKNPNSSTPESLVEALVCTEGLGKFVSGLAFPSNPPDVQSFFHNLGEKWWSMAIFLGYAKNELEVAVTESGSTYQQQITLFLTMFDMPACGTRSVPILHRAAQKAGISSGLSRKNQRPYALGLPGLPSLELHESQPNKLATNFVENFVQPLSFRSETPRVAPVLLVAPVVQALTGYLQVFTEVMQESLESRAQQKQKDVEETQCQDNDIHAHVGEAEPKNPSAAEVIAAQVPMRQNASHSQDSNRYDYERNSSSDLIIQCMKKDDSAAVEVVRTLLESGASLKVKTEEDGSLPLHLAVLSKSFQMLSLLTRYYSNMGMIDAVRDDHKTALMLACLEKSYDFVCILLENGADADAKDCEGLSCLHYKATLESPDIVQLLVDKEAKVDNLADGTKSSPLTHACHYGQVQSVEIFLSANANPNGLPGAVITPLCAAIEAGHERLVYLLHDHQADMNLQDQVGNTPILRACKNGNVELVSKLINMNADLNIANKEGNTPILVAVETHNVKLLQLLVACKADVNHYKVIQSGNPPKEVEHTPLILAAGRGHLDMVEILVENKANVNYCSPRTASALSFAVGGGHTEVVEFFLKVNEVIKTIDSLSVPLITAVSGEDQYILKLLLDVFGGYEKALHQATEAGMQQLVDSLCQLDDNVRRMRTASTTSKVTDENLRLLQHLSRREMQTYIDQTFNEFVHAAITTAERKQERSQIIEEARTTGNEHVVLFLEQYFNSDGSHPDPVFPEFINITPFPSPAYFLFGSENLFDGATFKQVLEDMKSNVMEFLPIALMQLIQTDDPGYQGLSAFDGPVLMASVLGPRFYQEVVKPLGLLDAPKPPPRPISRASVSDRESVHTDDADHGESNSPLPPQSMKPAEKVESQRSPTTSETDTDLPDLTHSGHDWPEELEDHVTAIEPEPTEIDVDTAVTEQ